jgi:putative MATE family efflux protein
VNEKNYELKNSPILNLLMKYSTPAIIGMIVNSLYNVVDTIVIGRGVGTLAIAALTICFPIQMIILACGQTIGIGSASIVSRSLGAKNPAYANKAAANSFAFSIIIGLIVMALGLYFLKPLLLLFGAMENFLPYAVEYLQIILLGSPFFVFAVSTNNVVRSEGNPIAAMISMTLGCVLNIILDPIFVFTFDMGVKGVAYATIISQFASFAYLLYYFKSGKNLLEIKFPDILNMDYKLTKEMFSIGTSAFMRNIAGSLLAIFLNNSLKIYGGELYIAIFGIINRMLMLMFMPTFGIVQGMQPIVGFNYGAKQFSRAKEAVLTSLKVMTVYLVICFIISEVFPKQIFMLFSKDSEVFLNGVPIMRIIMLVIPFISIQLVGTTYAQAIGRAVPALIFSMMRQILFFIPLLFILPRFFGLTGVWYCFPIADFLSCIIILFWLLSEMKKLDIYDNTKLS